MLAPWLWWIFAVIVFVASANAFQPLHLTQRTSSLWQSSDDAVVSAPTLTDHAPLWETLRDQILATPTGAQLEQESLLNDQGRGPPHTDALLRLHGTTTTPRVTLFRDASAWCPYCQKVWLFLELKKIPFQCQKLPMNAYGDKPAWYTRKVDGGFLPALELDGELHVESLDIIQLLEKTFAENGPNMIPSKQDANVYKRYEELLQLELELQRAWFSLTFYPVKYEALTQANDTLLASMAQVDHELGGTPGPWFLGGDDPSLVDIQFITQVERIIPSVLYWKGLAIRDSLLFPNLDRWLAAWETLPAYLASRSDYYTHAMVIPSQNGPGYMIPQAKSIASQICGLSSGAWQLPLATQIEPFPELRLRGPDYNPAHEAAYKVIKNHAKIVPFACRGAGEPGRPAFHAELADPYCEPNEELTQPVDVSLRHVANALLRGIDVASEAAAKDLCGKSGNDVLRENWEAYQDESDESLTYYWNYETGDATWTPPTQQLDTCLTYTRDRVGVPRDMGPAAAMQLRAHLNWAIDLMRRRRGC